MAKRHHPIVSLRVGPERAELAQLMAWELGATGIEELDETTLVRSPHAGDVVLRVSFEDESSAERACEVLGRDFRAELVHVEDADWAVEWRRGLGPQRIGRRLLLQPSWAKIAEPTDLAVVTIDPENAFGSGDHASTRLVLRALEGRIRGGERVLDVGCGSGILSIAALELGAASAFGIDVDDDAVVVARRNAQRNEVTDRFHASTTPVSAVDGRFDVVVANIETRVLTGIRHSLHACLKPQGFLVLAGILIGERDEILAAFSALQTIEVLEEGEWLALVMGSRSA
jgi:ribosomal protein L11 methyltransferase